jgi:hypothetical protein
MNGKSNAGFGPSLIEEGGNPTVREGALPAIDFPGPSPYGRDSIMRSGKNFFREELAQKWHRGTISKPEIEADRCAVANTLGKSLRFR